VRGRTSLIDAYFAAWNAHDGAALVRLFAPGGSYEDPSTRGAIPAAALPALLERLAGAFPDLSFERGPVLGLEARAAAEWTLRGHHRGPLWPGVNPTGRPVELRGVDVFEEEGGLLRSVRGLFDQQTFAEQAGLMALVQPVEQGPARYGYSMRIPSGNPRPPDIIALTWIQGKDEGEKERIRAYSRQNV
jgi:steroid delta-isomerase-like uncharacterized protein